MSKGKQNLSGLFGSIKDEFVNFSNLYSKAVNRGANKAGKEIVEAIQELEKPSDLKTGKLVSAVKSGVIIAGSQVLSSVIDYVRKK